MQSTHLVHLLHISFFPFSFIFLHTHSNPLNPRNNPRKNSSSKYFLFLVVLYSTPINSLTRSLSNPPSLDLSASNTFHRYDIARSSLLVQIPTVPVTTRYSHLCSCRPIARALEGSASSSPSSVISTRARITQLCHWFVCSTLFPSEPSCSVNVIAMTTPRILFQDRAVSIKAKDSWR